MSIEVAGGEESFVAAGTVEEEVCCICSHGDNLTKTTCGHQLHLHCMLQWCGKKVSQHADTTCPICRAVLLPSTANSNQNSVPIASITGGQRFIRTGHNGNGNAAVLPQLFTAGVNEELDQMVGMLLRNIQHDNPLDAMMDAICTGNIETVQSIIIATPEIVNARREDGTTLLQHAVYRNHVDILDLLLSNDANPRLADRFGITPLHAAVTVGNVSSSRRLLGKGACVEAADKNGETALFYALRAKDVAMVSLLLRKKADVNAENRMGNTVLHLLAHGEYPHNITALLRQAKPRCLGSCNYIGDTPLHIAVENCNLDFIRKFKHLIPYHSRFITNHVGCSAEDYVEPQQVRYDGIRQLLLQWQRPQHEQDEDNAGEQEIVNSIQVDFVQDFSASTVSAASDDEDALLIP
jgi:hypothetical protein